MEQNTCGLEQSNLNVGLDWIYLTTLTNQLTVIINEITLVLVKKLLLVRMILERRRRVGDCGLSKLCLSSRSMCLSSRSLCLS